MKFLYNFAAVLLIYSHTVSALLGENVICYYDSKSSEREGAAHFSMADLEYSLQFCTHIVYGYAGINAETFQLTSINPTLDIQKRHFATITALKDRNPHIKFLLSVGGDHDLDNPDKYIRLLEAGRVKQDYFIQSVREFLRSYDFDGLDLAFQLPRNKPRKVHSGLGMTWKNFKKFFTGDEIVDEYAPDHKEQFTDLVKDMRISFRNDNFMITLTVLPNVNSSWYYDAPALINNLDFVNLATFDFLTPERNPEEADFAAPLYEFHDQDRLDHYNINYQVEYWLLQRVPASKLNVGIAAYGRAWQITKESGNTGTPVIKNTKGAAPAGTLTNTPGLLSWPEICKKLPNALTMPTKIADEMLRSVSDPMKKYGTYAYRLVDKKGENGIWVSYEDPSTASYKAGYVKARNLGGVALFDISMDDFRGQCNGEKFPLLRSIKHRLL